MQRHTKSTVTLDAEGRCFDFHALCHTLCTHLREARVGLPDAMAIMLHSDPPLTMRVYTDKRQIGVAAEVAKLPDFGAIDALLVASVCTRSGPPICKRHPAASATVCQVRTMRHSPHLADKNRQPTACFVLSPTTTGMMCS